jgi:hypothetical protein
MVCPLIGSYKMRNTITLLFIIAIILLIAGCGDNTSRAKEYLNNGDAYEKRVSELAGELQSTSSDFYTFGYEKAKQGQMPDEFIEEWKPLMDDCINLIDQVFESLQNAESEYMKIKGLEGVEEYKEYADMMIQYIDIQTSYYALERDMVTNQYENFADPGLSLESIDKALVELQDLHEQSSELYDQMKQLNEEIERYKEDILGMTVTWEEKRGL